MRIDAWIMLIFGCVILYGGLTRSLIIASKHSKMPRPEGFTEEDDADELPPVTM
ncbi:MAG: MetS family NSS transporter small subunit [bacterium]|nr:MetS family NSS transporter small subunit [bacterium]